MKMIVLPLAVFLLGSASLGAVTPPVSAPQTMTIGTAAPFNPAAATRAWLETVPAEQRAKSDAYFEGGYWLILWNPLEEIIFFDHPSGRARIRMAMDWKAANLPAGDFGTAPAVSR